MKGDKVRHQKLPDTHAHTILFILVISKLLDDLDIYIYIYNQDNKYWHTDIKSFDIIITTLSLCLCPVNKRRI